MTDSNMKIQFDPSIMKLLQEVIPIVNVEILNKNLLKLLKVMSLPEFKPTCSKESKNVDEKPADYQTTQENQLIFMQKHIFYRLFCYLFDIDFRLRKITKMFGYRGYPELDDYIKEICWKERGEIDEIETFKSIYNKRPNDVYCNIFFLFEEACNLCLVEYIELIWNNHCDEYNVIAYKLWDMIEIKICRNELPNDYLSYYWIIYILKKGREAWFFKELNNNYDYKPSCNINNNREMFFYSIMTKNINATNFFLNKLNFNEKNLVLEIASEWIIEKRILNYDKSSKLMSIIQTQFVIILIFLLENMNDFSERKKFLYKYDDTILKRLLLFNGINFYNYCMTGNNI